MPAKKDTFIFRKKYRNQIQKLTANQRLDLMEGVFSYQLDGKYESKNDVVSVLLDIMIDEWKKDEERYEEVCEKNRENGMLGGRPPKTQKNPTVSEKPKKAKKPKKADMINDCDHDYDSECDMLSLKEISSYEEIEQSSLKKKVMREKIDNLIEQLKQECDNLGVAYDKQKEREFARHILSAKEYGGFCEKVGMGREEFAVKVLIASVKINFRPSFCTGPMKIYQHYAEVYNKTLQQHGKNQKNLIQSF